MAGDSPMPGGTRIAQQAAGGERQAASAMLPLVYEQLRAIARQRMALERAAGAGHTLQPTALIHEAYARLVRQSSGGPAAPATDASRAPPPAWRDQREF